ncbi:N-acyl-D-amino-acid deacylase [Deinobacterium chartae]|uniref:N-acyl-D-amino-acid deacylase n=1 Tax=Deinobacterium chartae TaxID=521158 RepID=A0A841I0S7_9DEIO|nr:serine hydrolase domain-containing protein [Deinobacterium chartae]MBB6099391.1 N-acyl-D-amino-acid deacylase [Deinobacterium chartae]
MLMVACGSSSLESSATPGQAAQIVLRPQGLPAGATPSATVRTSGYSQQLTPQTPVTVRSGQLTLVGTSVVWNGTRYQAQPPTHLEVRQGQTLPVDLNYLPLAVSGRVDSALQPLDMALQEFVGQHNIPAATLAIVRNGQVLAERGYGWLDPNRTRAVSPQTPMRLASVTKPFTAALVRKLIAQGKLQASTPVFAYLGLAPLQGDTPDPRLSSITVEHLLNHRGGWNRELSFDPATDTRPIAKRLGLSRTPTPQEIARYMMGQPLQHAPGSTYAYSNLGYILLGLVAEKASGTTYASALQSNLLAPLHLSSVQPGRSLPADRNPNEPFYSDPGTCLSELAPNSTQIIPCADGGFSLETGLANGGLIASATDVARFFDRYTAQGIEQPASAGGVSYHTGALAGTFTLAYRSRGYAVVVLFNQRRAALGDDVSIYDGVRNLVESKLP